MIASISTNNYVAQQLDDYILSSSNEKIGQIWDAYYEPVIHDR